jgi:uncharacterized protein (TIGR04206 family)
MWVKSEYASELAVLSAWVAMVLPWNVVYFPNAAGGSTVVFLRFALVEIQVRAATIITLVNNRTGDVRRVAADGLLAQQFPGTELAADVFVTTPPTSALFYEAPELQQASLAWTVAAASFLLAFVLSLALYTKEEAVRERLPVDPVRLLGALLAAGTVGTALATWLYYLARDLAGTPIPVGVVIIGVLAVVLLRAERV